MKNCLNELVAHTQALGNISFVKITGDEDTTAIEALSDEKSVILQGKYKNPVPEFIGVFGMPHLNKLNIVLNIPEYAEDAKITVTKKKIGDTEYPSGLHFENKVGDFKNDYRFMTSQIVNEKLKEITFKGVKWNVTVVPTVASIQKLKFQAQANSEEPLFSVKTEKQDLKFFFGDAANHAGNFVFESNVTGTLSKSWDWPVKAVIDILNLVGDKKMMISDEGVLQITVDSGVAEYNYLLPAHAK